MQAKVDQTLLTDHCLCMCISILVHVCVCVCVPMCFHQYCVYLCIWCMCEEDREGIFECQNVFFNQHQQSAQYFV